tara:strand:+ start:752 stop:1096 length:345 start_codon:yes stop_codon:yes gene_type:complete
MYNWLNANIKKQSTKSSNKKTLLNAIANAPVGTKLIDVLDEMNLKEDNTNKMVLSKLSKLSRIIFSVDKYNDDAVFVSNIMEDLIQSPGKRITKLEIKECNELYRRYNDKRKRI